MDHKVALMGKHQIICAPIEKFCLVHDNKNKDDCYWFEIAPCIECFQNSKSSFENSNVYLNKHDFNQIIIKQTRDYCEMKLFETDGTMWLTILHWARFLKCNSNWKKIKKRLRCLNSLIITFIENPNPNWIPDFQIQINRQNIHCTRTINFHNTESIDQSINEITKTSKQIKIVSTRIEEMEENVPSMKEGGTVISIIVMIVLMTIRRWRRARRRRRRRRRWRISIVEITLISLMWRRRQRLMAGISRLRRTVPYGREEKNEMKWKWKIRIRRRRRSGSHREEGRFPAEDVGSRRGNS